MLSPRLKGALEHQQDLSQNSQGLSSHWFTARAKYVPLSDANGVNLGTRHYNRRGSECLYLNQPAPRFVLSLKTGFKP